MLSLQIPPTERRVVGLCWEKSKPKGPKGSRASGDNVLALFDRVGRRGPPPVLDRGGRHLLEDLAEPRLVRDVFGRLSRLGDLDFFHLLFPRLRLRLDRDEPQLLGAPLQGLREPARLGHRLGLRRPDALVELDHVRGLARQHLEEGLLMGRELARGAVVEHAERPDPERPPRLVPGHERHAGVRLDLQSAHHQRVVPKPWVLPSVLHLQHVVGENGVSAERDVAHGLSLLEPVRRFKELPVFVHQRDAGNVELETPCRRLGDSVELGVAGLREHVRDLAEVLHAEVVVVG
mmetsp:Transcript_20602/g.47736  ORF Transcript_20602/g.47736 Transcript_20602/m.47736 type:complete len:291 (+) Transcript_20602:143-1015(+)